MNKLVFLGAPGAGKGTLAAEAAKYLGVPHISTGDIFRAAIKDKTPLGLKVDGIIKSGALVDDDTTCALVKERLAKSDASNGYILDGFPRTIAQADALESFSPTDKVVNFVLSGEKIMERLGGRLLCKKCGEGYHKTFNPPKKPGVCDKCGGELYTRDDDKPEAIKKRLDVYEKQTAPLIDYYKKRGVLADIDASPSPEAVFENFKKIV
jgi:adenylate kinase